MSFNQASTNLIEKQLDNGISTVYHRSKDLKIALEGKTRRYISLIMRLGLLGKLDSELAQGREPNWASLLDSYALITGKVKKNAALNRYKSFLRL